MQRKQRLIKPKPNINPKDSKLDKSEIKLLPKWQIIQNSKQKYSNSLNELKDEQSNECQGLQPCGTTTFKAPIQTMKPTSGPRKATLMTENGPIDV